MDPNLEAVSKVTVPDILDRKLRGERITCLTAYDYPTARLVDEAGIDTILVGDSLAQTVLGYDSTVPVTVDEMLHHLKAVRRAVRRALLMVDLPFGAYHTEPGRAVEAAESHIFDRLAQPVAFAGVQFQSSFGIAEYECVQDHALRIAEGFSLDDIQAEARYCARERRK